MKVRATKKNGLPIRGERSHGARVEIVDILACGEEFEAAEEYDGWLYIEGKGWCDAYHTEPVEFNAGGGGGAATRHPGRGPARCECPKRRRNSCPPRPKSREDSSVARG